MSDAPRILVLHGPNLGLLGSREPERYGRATLASVNAGIEAHAAARGATVRIEQHDGEGALVGAIHGAAGTADGIVINPAAYTHTSVAVRDALLGVGLPFVEVHLTICEAREPFRHTSLVADIAAGRVSGFGPASYLLGLDGLLSVLRG